MKKHGPLEVFIDFDGTITTVDSLEYILDKYATRDWRPIEAQVTRHQLAEREALQKEFDLVHVPVAQALDDLRQIDIDPGFPDFVSFCRQHAIPLLILSGGFDIFIETILKRHGLNGLTFRANSIRVSKGRWRVESINAPRLCETANHCKCFWLEQSRQRGHTLVYIGDGNTDRCPAERADIRLAKGNLKDSLEEKHLSFYLYDNFNDVITIFKNEILKNEDKSK